MKLSIGLIMTIFVISATPSHATVIPVKERTEEMEQILNIQQVLADCGFNPGPISGVWGNQTTKAATAFVQAHGWTPSDDPAQLMVQVDKKRAGETGLCPPVGTGQADNPGGPWDEIWDCGPMRLHQDGSSDGLVIYGDNHIPATYRMEGIIRTWRWEFVELPDRKGVYHQRYAITVRDTGYGTRQADFFDFDLKTDQDGNATSQAAFDCRIRQ